VIQGPSCSKSEASHAQSGTVEVATLQDEKLELCYPVPILEQFLEGSGRPFRMRYPDPELHAEMPRWFSILMELRGRMGGIEGTPWHIVLSTFETVLSDWNLLKGRLAKVFYSEQGRFSWPWA